jgi:hypothetical protein
MLVSVKNPALARLVEATRRPVETALARAMWALLLVAVVGAAHLARSGSATTRWVAAGMICAALIQLVVHRWVFRRRFRTEAGAIRSTVSHTDPALGGKLERAVRLTHAVGERAGGQSAELAHLHLERTIARIDEPRMQRSARQRARGWRQLAVVGVAGAAFVVAVAPWHSLEGANVLLSRNGAAPLAMDWLELVQVAATPPSYLRQKETFLRFGTQVALPEGTEVSVRGVAVRSERELVLTDGEVEVEFVADGAGSVVAHWVLERTTTLFVAARFGQTRISEERRLEIHSRVDQLPTVQLQGAPREFRLEELDRLELLWKASDDHSLTQVDLVLRSAGKEERRSLESFPADKRTGSGGHVLKADDPFLKRVFLPVVVRVEARDNDPREGDKWGKSAAFILRPPGVGSPELARYQALVGLRTQLVELLAAYLDAAKAEVPSPARAVRTEMLERLAKLRASSAEVLAASYGSLTVPGGWSAFIEGQLQRLEKALNRHKDEQQTLESIVLGVNSALGTLATQDSREVSKQLGDVAEEAAFAARLAQDAEKRGDGVERLAIAIQVLQSGAKELLQLGTLGADLGAVALGDLGRVMRSTDREDFLHAELAALHMAERLHRPNKSFGSKGGGGGGVESGSGGGGGEGSDAQGEPSEADSDFQRMARDLERLAQEHAELMDRTGSALRAAEDSAATSGQDVREEAERRAASLRESVVRLPQPGETPGTGRASAALAREHAGAMAHELERLDFERALESGRRAKAAAEEAARGGDLDPTTRSDVQRALSALEEQLRWTRERADMQERLTEQAAREKLGELSGFERELAERAGRLSTESSGQAALPQDVRDRLERAGRLMKDAAVELEAGRGKGAGELQLEAQRLLEDSETGEMQDDPSGDGSTGHDDKEGGRAPSHGGDVPDPEDRNRAEDFRRRVLEGLGKKGGGRLDPAIKRYAEGLLR